MLTGNQAALLLDKEEDKLGTSISIPPTKEENALESLYNYFIKEMSGDPIPFGQWEKVSVALEILGGSGGIYAWPPAWEYSKDKSPWLAYSITLTNPVSNVLFLAKATDDLFDYIAMELTTPLELKDILELPTTRELTIKYIKMLLGSIICAIPFGIAVDLFPLPNCESKSCLASIVTHALAANTILHAISWNFILMPAFWYYRLPILPLEKMYDYIQVQRLTDTQRELLEIKQNQEDIFQKYKNHLSQFFVSGVEKMVDDYIKNRGKSGNPISLKAIEDKSNTSLILFAKAIPEEKSILPAIQPLSFFNNWGIGFLGGTFMIVGCIGWIANPIYLGLKENLTVTQSIAAGILPAYSTAVLCAFYGSAIIKQVYHYLTSWSGNCSDKFSLEARLYPKTFAIFLVLNAYVAAFSYGTAQQLIITLFGDSMWDNYRPYLQDISIPALQILSFVPLLGLFNAFIRKSIAKFGAEGDHKLAARLLTKSNIISQRLQQMNGEILMASIEQYLPIQQKALRIDPNEFNRDMDRLKELKLQKEKTMKEEKLSQSIDERITPNRSPAQFYRKATMNIAQYSKVEEEVQNNKTSNRRCCVIL